MVKIAFNRSYVIVFCTARKLFCASKQTKSSKGIQKWEESNWYALK